MGMCYSLRPRLFSDPSSGGPDTELRPGAGAEQPHQGDTAARLRSADGPGLQLRRRETDWQPQQNGAEGERAPPPLQLGSKGPDRDKHKGDKPRPQDAEADREAKKVSKCIDKMLKQQKREYKQTHRLLLLARYGSCSAQDCKKLQRVVDVAQNIMKTKRPSISSVCTSHSLGNALNIIEDSHLPSQMFFHLPPLPLGRRDQELRAHTRLKDGFYTTVRSLLNRPLLSQDELDLSMYLFMD